MGIQTAERGLATYSTTRAPGTSSFGPAAVEHLREAGIDLFDWQAAWLDELLEVDQAGRLTRTTAALICPRRNGKTWAIAARALVGMLFLDERRVLYSAHLADTCQELFRVMKDLVAHPAIAPEVAHVYDSNGKERIEFRNGASFHIRTRTGHGGRGRETDLLILDEALILDPTHEAALLPLTAKAAAQGRGQVIYASSAGSTAEESAILLRLRDRGRAFAGTAPAGFAYTEFCADRRDDPTSPATWAAANPSLGTAILAEQFLADQQLRMGPTEFATEHLGVWADAAELPRIDPVEWAALVAEERPEAADPSMWLTFDLAPDRTAARVLGFYRTLDGRIAVSVLHSIDDEAGINGDVYAQLVLGLCEQHDPEIVGFDRLTGDHVAQVLGNHGWRERLRPLNGTKTANGCASLETAVRLGAICHDGHPAVTGDLGRAVARPFADGGWLFARKNSNSGPIAAAVALANGMYLAGDELLA